jgi:hypothetical protein
MQRLRDTITHLPWRGLFVFVAISLLLPFSAPSYAQTDVRTFSETGHTLRGAFRFFWETKGGLPLFGYPLTEEYTAPSTGRLTQYFERARFELIHQNGQYTVELGKIGIEYTTNRIFPKSPPIQNTPTRRYIPQTQHIIQYGFKEIWETRGGEGIFGWPISEEVNEIVDDGAWHTVQYFERARFEYWPTLPPGQRILMSTLGRKLAPSDTPSAPPAPQPATPSPVTPSPVTPSPPLPPPSFVNCAVVSNPASAPGYPVVIAAIDKVAETVTLTNVSAAPVDLTDWKMCSVTGGQEHPISGILASGASRTFPGPSGFIWNNSASDPGALWNPRGQLVSYWAN